MGLNDLMNEIKQDAHSFQGDDGIETKVLNQVLALVEDKISEVKNQAVKWYALYFSWNAFEMELSLTCVTLVWVSSSRSFVRHRWRLSWTSLSCSLLDLMKSYEISQPLVRLYCWIFSECLTDSRVWIALKTITAELPADGKIAASACLKLAPKLIEQLQNVRLLSPTYFSLSLTHNCFSPRPHRKHSSKRYPSCPF